MESSQIPLWSLLSEVKVPHYSTLRSKVERGMSPVSHHVSHQKEHGGWIIGGWILKQTISYRAVYIIERNLYVIYSSQKINSYSVMKFPRAIADDRILECPRNEENDPRNFSNTQVGS